MLLDCLGEKRGCLNRHRIGPPARGQGVLRRSIVADHRPPRVGEVSDATKPNLSGSGCLLATFAGTFRAPRARGVQQSTGALNAIAAAAFGAVESFVGSREQALTAAGAGETGDAETGSYRDCHAVLDRDATIGERLPDPLAEPSPARGVGTGQDECELLPAPATGGVDLA